MSTMKIETLKVKDFYEQTLLVAPYSWNRSANEISCISLVADLLCNTC